MAAGPGVAGRRGGRVVVRALAVAAVVCRRGDLDRGHIHSHLSDWLPIELQSQDFTVSGWVDGFPNESAEQVGFSFRVQAGEPEGTVPERLRLTWYDPPPDVIGPGSVLDLVVRLKRPRGLMNPGGFDYARWLFQEGYGATGYVREGSAAVHETGGIPRRWLMFRARLAESIRRRRRRRTRRHCRWL